MSRPCQPRCPVEDLTICGRGSPHFEIAERCPTIRVGGSDTADDIRRPCSPCNDIETGFLHVVTGAVDNLDDRLHAYEEAAADPGRGPLDPQAGGGTRHKIHIRDQRTRPLEFGAVEGDLQGNRPCRTTDCQFGELGDTGIVRFCSTVFDDVAAERIFHRHRHGDAALRHGVSVRIDELRLDCRCGTTCPRARNRVDGCDSVRIPGDDLEVLGNGLGSAHRLAHQNRCAERVVADLGRGDYQCGDRPGIAREPGRPQRVIDILTDGDASCSVEIVVLVEQLNDTTDLPSCGNARGHVGECDPEKQSEVECDRPGKREATEDISDRVRTNFAANPEVRELCGARVVELCGEVRRRGDGGGIGNHKRGIARDFRYVVAERIDNLDLRCYREIQPASGSTGFDRESQARGGTVKHFDRGFECLQRAVLKFENETRSTRVTRDGQVGERCASV